MNWSRLTPWLIGAAAAMLLAGTLGYTLGTGSSTTTAEADSARQESYDAAYQSTFARFETTARKMGLASGSKRGIRAGRKTGGREGTAWGGGQPGSEGSVVVLTLLPQLLTVLEDYETMVFGAVLIATMVFFPQGVVPTLVERWRRWRQ